MGRQFTPFKVSTPEHVHVTFSYAVCGHSAHMENLIRFNLLELRFYFKFSEPMKVDLQERKNKKMLTKHLLRYKRFFKIKTYQRN